LPPDSRMGGPNGTTRSESSWLYVPQANLSSGFAAESRGECAGEPYEYFSPALDSDAGRFQVENVSWSCVAPHGRCSRDGIEVLRCTHSDGHIWPFMQSDRGFVFRWYARVVWEFFRAHPKVKALH
jgi:hypothetical protein